MGINSTNPIFHDEAKATAHIEAQRWGGKPSCPHCGSLAVRKMGGKTQAGMFLCNDCRGKFTVRTGTVMERSGREIKLKIGKEDIETIPISDIAEQETLPSSMPSMESKLTRREIRDLVAYLASLHGEES